MNRKTTRIISVVIAAIVVVSMIMGMVVSFG